MTEDEFRHGKAPPQQLTPGRPGEPSSVRDASSLQHERMAADWPAPPRVQVREDGPRFLPDTRNWGTRQWLTAAALVTLLALTVVSVAYDPSIAPRWVEALFGKVAGLFGG